MGEHPVPMVGRELELTVIHRGLIAAAEGTLTLTSIQGEAGIGKTRLIEAAVEEAAGLGFAIYSGGGRELEQDLPLAALQEAFGLNTTTTDADRARLAQLAAGEGIDGDPGQALARFNNGLVDWIARMADQDPILIAIDDAQWLDAASLAALARIVRALPMYSIALLVALRPVPRRKELDSLLAQFDRASGTTRVFLEPLADSAVGQMAGDIVGPNDKARMSLLSRAGGNPLLVTELLRHFKSEDFDGAEDSAFELPTSLRVSILQRLGYLSDRCLQVLRTAAVLGTEVDLRELAVATGLAARELLLILEEAVAAEILVELGGGLAFRHDVVREAIYEERPAPLRAGSHAEIASALEKAGMPLTSVAAHLLRAGPVRSLDDIAARTRVARGIATHAPGMAAGLLRDVLDGWLEDSQKDRDDVLADLAQTILWSGDWKTAEQVAREALPRVGGPAEGRLLTTLALALTHKGKLDASVGRFAEAAARSDDLEMRARLLTLEARNLFLLGHSARAREVANEALGTAEAAGAEGVAGVALTIFASLAFLSGHASDALALSTRACDLTQGRVPLSDRLDDPYMWRASALAELGRYAEAKEYFDIARRRAEDDGSLFSLFLAHRQRGLMNFRMGQWDDAIAEAESSVAVSEAMEFRWAVVDLALLGRICCYRDDLAEADRFISRAEKIVPISDYRIVNDTLTRWGRALIHESRGELEDAFRVIETARSQVEKSDFTLMNERIGGDFTRLAMIVGETRAAEQMSFAVEQLAARLQTPMVIGLALRCRGLVERDASLLLQAVEHFEGGPDAPALAEAREDAGRQLVADGRTEDAVGVLDTALAFWKQVDARRNIARVRAALRDAGVNRRAPAGRSVRGWESLTDTENRVVDLLSEGLYYREVADRLFISRRTVEAHVSHIFRKLGVASRRELERAMATRQARLLEPK